MNDLLDISLHTMLVVLSKLITLPSSYSAEENTSLPRSLSNTSNTSLIWVSADNSMRSVYIALASLLPRHLYNSLLESGSLKTTVCSCCSLEFCLREINSAVVVVAVMVFLFFWWLFHCHVVTHGWPALLDNSGDIWLQVESCKLCLA